MDARELYRRWIDELWNGSVEVAAELVTPDFVGHWPDRDVHGPAELAAIIDETHGMLDVLSFVIEVGPLVDGDLVAGRWRGRGAQDGNPVTFVGNDLLRVADGRFAEYWVASLPLP
ncbi:ester cyclase [Actinomycetospora soli]|uniref:ester cyclase n=1 Tax=Actinomycetospora soli TaxID=2893887 RepID=UPI001E41449F|nr:nuclear transport factor 2 family protein [Actinomycetospora soli]MCD2188049.1 nuclear transport factor 2 family protein [Actinomycetospora soli]